LRAGRRPALKKKYIFAFMMTAIALDDEPPALAVIDTFCQKIDYIRLEKTFTGTTEAMSFLRQYPIDLLFLDINMPSVSGIDFYKSIPQPSLVIFTTSYRDYAVESYEVNAVDYLLKPFTFNRFQQAVEKAVCRRQEAAQVPQLVLRVDYGLVKVFISDIQYIEGWDNYLKIYLKSQKPLLVRMTMKAIMEKLPQKDFIRVHRSYIVALSAIEIVRNKQILIAGSDIPLGNSYESAFFEVFKS